MVKENGKKRRRTEFLGNEKENRVGAQVKRSGTVKKEIGAKKHGTGRGADVDYLEREELPLWDVQNEGGSLANRRENLSDTKELEDVIGKKGCSKPVSKPLSR